LFVVVCNLYLDTHTRTVLVLVAILRVSWFSLYSLSIRPV